MNSMTDEQLDLAIARYLDWRSQRLEGAPDAYGMARRLAGDRPMSWMRPRSHLSAIAAVGILVLLAVGTLLMAGAVQRRTDPITNGKIVVSGVEWRAFDQESGLVSGRAPCDGLCPDAYDFRLAPDGWSVYFVHEDQNEPSSDRPRTEIRRWDRRDNLISRVDGCRAACHLRTPTPSPDGRYLAYTHDGAVAVVDLGSGRVIQRIDLSPDPEFDPYPAWDPAGRLLVLRRPHDVDSTNLLIDVETGASTGFELPRPGVVLASLDGSTMVLVHADRDAVGLSVLDPDLVEARLVFEEAGASVTNVRDVWNAVIAPDGTAVAILVAPSDQPASAYELRIVDIATGAVSTQVADTTAGQMLWLPAD